MFDFKDELRVAVKAISSLLSDTPTKVALISGSGLGGVIDEAVLVSSVDYGRIPGLPVPAVPGHGRKVGIAEFGGRRVLFFGGRAHLYEGHPTQRLGMAVRIAAAVGVDTLVITCAAGALKPGIAVGNIVVIRDHINLSGANPLIGVKPESDEQRFPDTSKLYDPELAAAAREKADELGIAAGEGVYAWVSGPSYETPAEVRMLSAMGADVAGMSLVPESLTAAQIGLRVLALACVTNAHCDHQEAELTHDEVLERADSMVTSLGRLIKEMLPILSD
ncbi:MAG TPA: purine-nucleoside phosphorylase [Acidobacteriota bacterium]|nr:purine-nucleoside phosphorylase [Acidobacteriota bacterium]